MKYIIALDQGTTSTRAVLFDKSGAIVSSYGREIEQFYPAPGLVEHAPMSTISAPSSNIRPICRSAPGTSGFPSFSRYLLPEKYESGVTLIIPITEIFLSGFAVFLLTMVVMSFP